MTESKNTKISVINVGGVAKELKDAAVRACIPDDASSANQLVTEQTVQTSFDETDVAHRVLASDTVALVPLDPEQTYTNAELCALVNQLVAIVNQLIPVHRATPTPPAPDPDEVVDGNGDESVGGSEGGENSPVTENDGETVQEQEVSSGEG